MGLIVFFAIYFAGMVLVLVKSHDRYVIRDTRRSFLRIPGYHLSGRYFSIMVVIAIIWPLLMAALIADKVMSEAED